MALEQETALQVRQRDNGRCVVCGKFAHDVHEVVPRSHLSGKANEATLFDVRNRCCLCRACHGQVHTVWGRVMLLGLLRLRYGYTYRDAPFESYFEVRSL